MQGYCDTSKGRGKTRLLLTGMEANGQSFVIASIASFVLILCLPPSLCANITARPICSISEYPAWEGSELPLWVASRWFETIRRLRYLFPHLDCSLPSSSSVAEEIEKIFDPIQRMQGALPAVSEEHEVSGESALGVYEELYSKWDGFVEDQTDGGLEIDGPRPASPVVQSSRAVVEPFTPQSGPASFHGVTPQPPKEAKTPASKKGGARFFRLFTTSSSS